MSRYLDSKYSSLTAYTPGEQPKKMKYVKLNTNESPYPPAPAVLKAIGEGELADLRLYSDPECSDLRAAIAQEYSTGGCALTKENIFVSNGSDDILNFAFMAFGEKGAAYADITYGFYKVFAALHGVDSEIIPLKDDFTLCPQEYYGKNKLVVIANPNAPTGIALSRDDIEGVVKANPDGVVLVDEAYVDFGGESCVPLTAKYDNLLVCMTFSKSRSLAGARLGFAIGSSELISDLELIKYSTNPYSVNRMTSLCGEAAIKSSAYYAEKCALIADTREKTSAALRSLGFEVLPSKTNFIFAASDKIDGGYLYGQLKERGVLVRHFDSPKIVRFNRITIGTPEDMDVLIAAVREITAKM